MAFIKKKSGSNFYDVPVLKKSGSDWVEVDVYKRSGSSWIKMTRQDYEKTFNATWSQAYRGNRNYIKRDDERSGKLTQGQYNPDPFWGVQRSLCGFGDIQSELAGADIKSVHLYLKAEHWYWYSGGKAVIGYHNHSYEPSTFSHSKYGQKVQEFSSRSQALWIPLSTAFGRGIRDGNYKGFSIYASSTSHLYYGYFRGAYDGSYKPKLKIKYSK